MDEGLAGEEQLVKDRPRRAADEGPLTKSSCCEENSRWGGIVEKTMEWGRMIEEKRRDRR